MNVSTLQEDQQKLNEALRDLGYELLKPVIWLADRLPGYKVKPWVRERQIRELHRKPSR